MTGGAGWLRLLLGGMAAAAAATVVAAAREARHPVVEHLRVRGSDGRLSMVPVPMRRASLAARMPPAEPPPPQGLRLVHLSDLHLHRRPESAHRAALSRLEQLSPQLVLVTGDVIDRASRPGVAADYLVGLARRWQVALVWGNHDHELPGVVHALTRALARAGAWVLVNRRACLVTPVGPVELVGVDAPNLGLDRLGAALAQPPAVRAWWDAGTRRWRPDVDGGAPSPAAEGPDARPRLRVLAAHSYHVLEHGVDLSEPSLVLVGDTHGGQVDLPLLGPVWARWVHRHRYVRGLSRVGGHWLYVNRGLGTIGVPLRLRCPPELLVVDLIAGGVDAT
ncbi:MAG: hypothetical protein GX496_10930 [Firmicutes bacterium]|nr:hypothetical protein [Bacillota bacterium]